MREILFRGKNSVTGRWVQGDLLHISSGCIIYHGSQTESEIKENTGAAIELLIDEVSVVNPETVGQFTGLTDKNGVNIFEGDILVDKEGSISVVKFGQFKAGKDDYGIEYMPVGFHILFSDNGTYCINLCGDGYAISSKECSIVGNVHENHELLKQALLSRYFLQVDKDTTKGKIIEQRAKKQ